MKTWLAFAVVSVAALFLSNPGAAQEKKAGAAQNEEKALPGHNTPPEGFTLLFNGKDLTGWQGCVTLPKRDSDPEKLKEQIKTATDGTFKVWSVQNGVIYNNGKGNSSSKYNLQTAKDYGNIELWCDWKIGKRGDSGIYLRGTPQVQIWDSPKGGSGGLDNNTKTKLGKNPLVHADKPVGEWNRFFIKMVGDKVTVKLNDKLVVDDVPLENYWANKGVKALPATGPIELQDHGDALWFKNIYIKELP
jgi:hypothetical protein